MDGQMCCLTALAFTLFATGAFSCKVSLQMSIAIGHQQISPAGIVFCAFEGIPYALPPVDKLRFKAPVKSSLLYGEHKFLKSSDVCVQPILENFPMNTTRGTEDCLYLNVYVQKSTLEYRIGNLRTPSAVMVWLHGGSFSLGSAQSDQNGPDYIVEQDIVVVTLNYRLGPMGFLKLPTAGIPGNAGLKDQRLALRWIRRNIAAFGGDYRSVTLAGWSAGAASVTYHMYAPSSRGLFHRAIAMSGTMLAPWAFNRNSQAYSRDIVRKLKTHSIMEANSRDVVLAGNYNRTLLGMVFLPFVPTVEVGITANGYLNVTPYRLRFQAPVNRVPLLIGHTSLEMNWPRFLMYDLESDAQLFPLRERTQLAIASKFIERLLSPAMSCEFKSHLSQTAQMEHGIWELVRQLQRTVPELDVFMYRFAFNNAFVRIKLEKGFDYGHNGAAHGDDLQFLFKPFNGTRVSHNDDLTRKRVIELWTNFIKFGNPTPDVYARRNNIKWTPATSGRLNFLNIDDRLEMRQKRRAPVERLWTKLFTCLFDEKCDSLNLAIVKWQTFLDANKNSTVVC